MLRFRKRSRRGPERRRSSLPVKARTTRAIPLGGEELAAKVSPAITRQLADFAVGSATMTRVP